MSNASGESFGALLRKLPAGLLNAIAAVRGSWLVLYGTGALLWGIALFTAAGQPGSIVETHLGHLVLGGLLLGTGYLVMRRQGKTLGDLFRLIIGGVGRLNLVGKFALLKIYRLLMILGALAVLVSGTNSAYDSAMWNEYVNGSSVDVFHLGPYLIYLLPSILLAVGLGIAAEIIQLFLNVEDHLFHIRQSADHPLSRPKAEPPAAPVPAVPGSDVPAPGSVSGD